MAQVLRKCIDCGLEARTEEDLENFRKQGKSKYGYLNICSACHNKRRKLKRQTNDRYYLHDRYQNMKQRCHNPEHFDYPYYGGRGVTVCREWLEEPEAFVDWALANGWTRELEIDRIDNNGSYSPDNCRFVTRIQQMRNTRIQEERKV